MPTPYPQINGHRYDFSSVVFKFDKAPYHGIKSITYKHGVEPGKFYGTSPSPIGATRGQYTAEGSVEFYKNEYDEFITALAVGGRGYMEQFFTGTVSYSEAPTLPVITDVLHGVRLISAENSHSEGSDPLVVRCDLLIFHITEHGKSPLNPRFKLF